MDVKRLSDCVIAYEFVIEASVNAFTKAKMGSMLLEPSVACSIVEAASQAMRFAMEGRLDGGEED